MNELGNLISENKSNETAVGSTLLIGLACFGLTVAMIALFIGEKEISFNKILFGACGIFALIGGIGCLQSVKRNLGGSVALYENGIVAEKGGKRHTARWEEIAVLYESVEKIYMKGVYVYDRYLYTIKKTNGEEFTLNNMIENIAEIGQVLKRQTLENLYSQAKREIENGGKVIFDSLFVDKEGLSGIVWADLANLKVKNDLLEIKDKKGKVVVHGSYAATPNAHLLLKLLEEHLLVKKD